MDQRPRYTYFPNLFDSIKSKHAQATLETDWPISRLPQELLIHSWATLLRSYTGITEPVFLLEGTAVQVDLARNSWNEVEVDGTKLEDGHHTSIALNKPLGESTVALALRYDARSGSTVLSSAGCIPQSFLPQILAQLRHITVSRATSGTLVPAGSPPLLSIVNPQRKVLSGPRFLHQLVHIAPSQSIAIDFFSSDKKRVLVSYQDLGQHSDRLARRLVSALTKAYDRPSALTNNLVVPVLIPQSPELYISQLAILKSGAAFCPLNLDVPPERLAFIMKDVGARVVVTAQDCRHRFSELDLGLHIISSVKDEDDEDAAIDSCIPGLSQVEQNCESLAYVMYTSGSTGLPKGVGIPHEAVTQALLAHDEYVPHFDRFLQFAAPTFDVSVFEIFFTFYRGATLVCCHREDMLSDLTGVMNELGVDAAEFTPTVAGTLLRNWDAVPCLKLLLTIGEMLPRSVIEHFAQSSDRHCTLLPMYGPTEASIHCTITHAIGTESKAGTIGRPLSTVSAFVISEDQHSEPHLLPIGHIGELAVAGQLAQGYVNRSEQTRAAFVTLPGHGRVYRTGDRARLIPSGELEYIGRIASGQVKIRGQRVELGEIEQVVCQVNEVRFAVASIIGGNIIVFCLLGDGTSTLASRQVLQEKCKSWLPPFMRPTDFVMLTKELPRLPSGKIDKQGLEALYIRQGLRATSNPDESASGYEILIINVIREELGIDVARHDDLWSKGLDSLRSIRLASKLRNRNIEIAATDILSADTIVTLSNTLQNRQVSRSSPASSVNSSEDSFEAMKAIICSELSATELSDMEDIVPCSQLQLAMLSESVISKKLNCNWIKIDIARSVSVTDCVRAFCRLAKLNEILRSGFIQSPEQESHFVRIIWKDFDFSGQIHYKEELPNGVSAPRELIDLNLLRPLRLEFVAHQNHRTLLVSVHHALYDGWSWDLMMADLVLLISGEEAPTRPQFQQFVECERAFLSSQEAKVAQEYWDDHLRDVAPTPLPVLTDVKCEAEIGTFRRNSTVDLSLLNATSKQLRISRHTIPSAAFATFLSFYCGTSEVVFGTVASGRTIPIPGIESIIGPCISTLPVKINFNHLRTVSDLLLHTHRLHHDFLQFGRLPLRDVKKAAGLTSGQAVFDTLFVWQESFGDRGDSESTLSVVDGRDSLQYALVLEIEPGRHQVQVKATYDASKFCAEQIQSLVSQFEAIVAYYTAASDAPWKEVLNHIQPQDLSVANTKFSSVDPAIGISSTLDRLARIDPTRIAIDFIDDFDPINAAMKASKVSYRELSQKAGLVSQFLLSRGVLVDELVCLFMAKSIELYVSILGILKTGAAYIVVDPQAPVERTRKILDGARCRHCLTTSTSENHEALNKVEAVLSFNNIIESAQLKLIPPKIEGMNLAYAVFTSGSTGTPKGVLVTRKNILSNIDALSRIYPSVENGALLQACSPAFDVSVFEILYTWHMGMRLCAASNDVLFRDIERFVDLLKVTHLSLTPSVAALIRPTQVPRVRMLVTAGEAVTWKVFRDWSGRGLYQGYGPSETTNICSVLCRVSPSDHINNIGQPLPNTSMFVSSRETFQPLPKGALGEIVIGGDQVGRGYLNDAKTTAEQFIHHEEHGRLYRSGDLGRMLPNGSILFHGRRDDQVKLRGQRIELGEIEHVLVHESTVSDAVCLLIEGSGQAQSRLVTYWSSKPSLHIDLTVHTKAVFAKLYSQLPEYMVPDYLIHVDALPLTSQGKSDRKALKRLFLSTEPAALEKSSRQDDTITEGVLLHADETKVAQAIMEVTGTPLSAIGRNTSFFALGLDSINCIGLSRKLRESGLKQIDVSLILRRASIARLLGVLPAIQEHDRPEQASESKLQPVFDDKWQESVRLKYSQKGFQVQKILPCTPLQEAMLSHAEGGDSGAYQNQLTFSVLGDLKQLKVAWSTCIAAHEILRTGFILTKSYRFPFAQVVLADVISPWSNENHSVREESGEDKIMMPPYSFRVAARSEGVAPRLILKIHHALYDAQAVSLLLLDVERAYINSPIEAVSLEPYLEYMVGLNPEKVDGFWRTHLRNYHPKLVSQPSSKRKASCNAEESLLHIRSKVPLEALFESSRQISVTALSLLQLSWSRLLATYSKDPDICFGNIYSGRNLPISGVEKIVGPCFNTLPVRVKLGKRDTNRQVARRLHDHSLAALCFQPSSLRLIQRNQEVRRFFDTLLLLQADPADLASSIWTLEEDIGDMKFPLILEVIPHSKSNQLDLILHAERGLMPPNGAEAVIADFDTLLEHTITYPDAIATDSTVLESKTPPLLMHTLFNPSTAASAGLAKRFCDERWSPMERYVYDVLREFQSDIRELARDTTIFQLGFDSITAIQIAARMRKEGYRISSGDVLEAATVPEIASLCEKCMFNGFDHRVSFDFNDFNKTHAAKVFQQYSLEHEAVEEIRPCTPFQAGILADFVQSQGKYYLNSVHYELDSDIDLQLLREAWGVSFLRHDILRSGFVEIDSVQRPFAMVVYLPGMCALPWFEDDASLIQNHEEYAHSMLRSLHEPPWRLVIRDQGIHKTMQLSMLHALFDARTLELLLAEVAAAYRGERLPEVVPLRPCLSRILHASSSQPANSVSTSSGQNVFPSPKFPNLHSHHVEDTGFDTIHYASAHSLPQLWASCRNVGVTLPVAAQCAWARVLSAYTAEPVSTFGIVLTGRSGDNGEDEVLFPCINTVPVSLKVGRVTNRALLTEAAKRNATHMKNPFAPFKAWSGRQGDLFDSLFVFQNRSLANRSAPWKVEAEVASANYTLSIELLSVGEESFDFRLTFRQEIIPAEQGKLLLKQFDALLLDTLDHLDDESSDFSHADSSLMATVPAKHSSIDTDLKYLHEFVENSSRKSPHKTAFEFAVNIVGEEAVKFSWTYSQLDDEGNKIAHILQQNGAIPGDLIGICFDKCPEASFAILGILKAGCAYVAIDPGAPEARKRFMLEDSDCRILCTTQEKASSMTLLENLRILSIDKLLKKNNLTSNAVGLSRELVADDVCYCLYTSGTTGTPKGCLITHGNAVQFVLAFQRLFDGHWDDDSRCLQFASFHFDVSVMEQYWSWSIGICVTSARRDLLFEDFPAAICALQITHIDLTPSLARLLTPEECPSLLRGAFITGGEQLRQDIIDVWGDAQVIYNGYGPSEVTIGCTMYPRIPKSAKPSNIGFAYDNVGAYVLDPLTKHTVLKGAIGELCVTGPLVGKGYLNRPELTAEKFEFLNRLQVRVYHTGDLVRLLHDGSFSFVGRADDQVKLRGQRLEIGEINQVIRQTSRTIKDIATMVSRRGEQAKEQLVTFIVSSESSAPPAYNGMESNPVPSLVHRVRRACNRTLPAYMVPTYILPITEMPLSPNNKIDNKALMALFEKMSVTQLHELSAAEGSPRDTDHFVMKRVISVISQVVGLREDALLASSRLFELGLDSISAISLSRLLKRAGFNAASPSMIMRNSVVADLVIALEELAPTVNESKRASQAAKLYIAAFDANHRAAVEKVLGIRNHAIEKIAPCTPLQGGMIARSLTSDAAAYFSSFSFAIDTSLELARLQAAWMHVEKENEILRTRFLPTDNGYAQVVLKSSASSPTRFQQSTIEREADLESTLKHDFLRWSERMRGLENKLWALTLYHGPQQILMTLHIFHGLYDGISLALILEEVARYYTGGPSLHPKPNYHDTLPLGPLLNLPGAQEFWTKHLDVVNLLNISFQGGGDEPIVISSALEPFNNVKQLKMQLNVAETAIFQACWLKALEEKVGYLPTIGVVVSGRTLDIDGIENVVGPLFNTIPCQLDGDALSTMADLVKACHSFNVDAMPYQHTQLSKISKWLQRKSKKPLFDSLFVFQKGAGTFSESRKLWTPIDSMSQSDYPLALEVEHGIDGSLACTIVAQSQDLSRKDVQELLEIFKRVLIDLLKDPHLPLTNQEEGRSTPAGSHLAESRWAGITKGKLIANGTVTTKTSFQWDATSKFMRSEIARLSGSDVHDVAPYTSIFELGLDSIDAIKLSARFKAAHIPTSVSKILQAGSIAEMVKNITEGNIYSESASQSSLRQVVEDLRRSLKIQAVPVDDYEKVLPVTPLQESMLANYQQYYSQDVLRLSTDVNVEKLKSAWSVVVSTHEILRTSFVEVDDPESASTYAQLVSRDVSLECVSTSLSCEAELRDLLSSQRDEAGRKGINQVALRLTFVLIGPTTFLIVGLPHAVYDGWSINLLHQDVARCYDGMLCVRPNYEPVLKVILGAVSEKSRTFWKNQLSDLHPRLFPRCQDEQLADLTINRHEMCSQIPLTQMIAFCRAEGVTLMSLALTCWALVLAQYLKSQDICFGVVLAGRNIENADEMMFPTMNTVPFRIMLHGNKLDVAKEVHRLTIAISEHQHFPLRKAKSLVRDSIGHLFDSLFIYQKRPSQSDDLASLYTSVGGLSDPEYPVNVEIEVLHDKIVWRAACKSNVLDVQGTQALLGNLDNGLRSIILEPFDSAFSSSSDGRLTGDLHADNDWNLKNSLPGVLAMISKNENNDHAAALRNEEVISEVLAIIANVQRQEITRSTSLFQLGLDSISAIKASSALKRRSISLPVSEMLEALTVERMVEIAKPLEAISEKWTRSQGRRRTPLLDQAFVRTTLEGAGILEDQVENVLPCTAGQDFFLGMWQASRGELFYPEFQYRIQGPLVNQRTINAAWQRLVQAVPVLRTTFLSTSQPKAPRLQVVLKNVLTSVVWTADEVQAPEDMDGVLRNRGNLPAMLFAAKLPSAIFLKLRIHHALYDGVSLPRMMNAFESFCNDSDSPSDLETDFHDYLDYIQDHTAIEQQKSFWMSYLTSSPSFPPLRTVSFGAGRVEIFRPGLIDNLSLIEKKLKESALSFQALFFAAYALAHFNMLQRSTSTPKESAELVVGVYLANRSHNHPDLPKLLAPTVNILPLKIPVGRRSSLFESAKAVQDGLAKIGSIEQCTVSLAKVYEWTGMKLDCFVNFLKLPDTERDPDPCHDHVRLEAIEPEDQLQDVVGKEVEEPPGPFADGEPVQDSSSVYLPSIDVEAAIRNGVLDVGIFAPAHLLDRPGVETLLDELRATFEELCEH